MSDEAAPNSAATPHKRRVRYAGKNPRRFEDKYKERDPQRHADTVAKVIAAGKTPAGTHRPIMVAEILQVLAPQPGELAVDCTLGYGGHAQEILARLQPNGRLLGLDHDPIELPKTEARLRALGFDEKVFTAHRSNFAGLPQVLATELGARLSQPQHGGNDETAAAGTAALHLGADLILADLGVSSMQIDDPARGFSVKFSGPLDMRMNPQRGQPVSALLEKIKPDALAALLAVNADEPKAVQLGAALAGKSFTTTHELADAIRAALPHVAKEDCHLNIRRVFQALRIAVNDEFSALETFLRHLPACLKPNGRVAVLTFHSGEDRRVKKAFETGLWGKVYSAIADEVIRATPEEQRSNPRSAPAKLRWARRSS
jgi:16S rRNA (cytosine1402-N4)-methyltransferase